MQTRRHSSQDQDSEENQSSDMAIRRSQRKRKLSKIQISFNRSLSLESVENEADTDKDDEEWTVTNNTRKKKLKTIPVDVDNILEPITGVTQVKAETQAPKRGRGRPRKNPVFSPVASSVPAKRAARGRPRKYPVVGETLVETLVPLEIKEESVSQDIEQAQLSPSVSPDSTMPDDNNNNINEITNNTILTAGRNSPISSTTDINIPKQHTPKQVRSPKLKKNYVYEPILPPCKICGAKASGYHFGAITCEACKVFFRRSLNKHTPYHCNNGKICQILPNRRISCSYCRLQKCIKLGMSRDCIQRGRYTVERKTECIRKVKELMLMQEEDFLTQHSDTDLSITPMSPEPRDLNDTDSLAAAIIQADSKSLMVTRDEMQQLLVKQTNHLEYLTLRESVFGHLEPLAAEEYKEIYRNTGIDVDNRRHKFAQCVLSFVTKITKFIEFSKQLPGFIDLEVSDQITLLREGMLDWAIISSYEMFNCEHMVLTCCSCHATYSRDDFFSLKDRRFYFQSFVAAALLRKLNLHTDELSLLKALVVFSPDGSEGQLQNKAAVERIQQNIVSSLLQTIAKNRGKEAKPVAVIFGHIVHGLTEVRATGLRYKQMLDECLKLFPDLEYPELLVEVLGDDIKAKLDSARAACVRENEAAHIRSSSLSSQESISTQMSSDNSQICPQITCDWLEDGSTSIYEDKTMYNNNMYENPDCLMPSLTETMPNDADYDVCNMIQCEETGIDRVLLLTQL